MFGAILQTISYMFLFSEIEYELINKDPSHCTESVITQVFKYSGNIKLYCFYLYLEEDSFESNKNVINEFLNDFKDSGMDTRNVVRPGCCIITGQHELLSVWRNTKPS